MISYKQWKNLNESFIPMGISSISSVASSEEDAEKMKLALEESKKKAMKKMLKDEEEVEVEPTGDGEVVEPASEKDEPEEEEDCEEVPDEDLEAEEEETGEDLDGDNEEGEDPEHVKKVLGMSKKKSKKASKKAMKKESQEEPEGIEISQEMVNWWKSVNGMIDPKLEPSFKPHKF